MKTSKQKFTKENLEPLDYYNAPGDILDFLEWMSREKGNSYSEQAIEGFNWDYVDDELVYPNGVKTHATHYKQTYGGRVYHLEVLWNSFSENITDSNVWVEKDADTKPGTEKPGTKTWRITWRSELFIDAASAEEAEEKFGELNLFSKAATNRKANWVETNSIEEY